MDTEVIKLRNNLNTFTSEELKKKAIKIKHLNFAVTRMRRNQVRQLIFNYGYLFPHLMNKVGTKKVAKPKTRKTSPASIKLPPQIIQQLLPIPTPRKRPVPAARTRKQQPVPVPRPRKQQELPPEFLQQIFQPGMTEKYAPLPQC